MGRGSVTTEQAGEQMPMPVRYNAKGEQVGGAAGSTRAFLEAARASTKTCTKRAMEVGRKTEREASGIGPTTLPPLCARDPFFFLVLLLL